jgi:carbon storage regulator CsrA
MEGRLCIKRREGETIRIGDAIVVEVIRTSEASCSLKIRAPKDVVILRGEIDDFEAKGPQDAGRQ